MSEPTEPNNRSMEQGACPKMFSPVNRLVAALENPDEAAAI
jgi:hypothetical protein